MNNTIIEIKNISKRYKLGIISTGTLHQDLSMLWSRFKGNNLSNVLVSNNDLKSYSNLNYTWALKDVNLKIERGEIYGIYCNFVVQKSKTGTDTRIPTWYSTVWVPGARNTDLP